MDIIHGAKYQNKETGEVVTFLGFKRKTVILRSESNGIVEVTREDFVSNALDLDDHDHATYCCTIHGTHAMPHQGCIFR